MSKKIKTALFFGSETGNTEEHALEIQKELIGTPLELMKDPMDLAETDVKEILNYDFIIIGSPTWNIGELQADIEAVFEDFDKLDLTNKQFAIYGNGDQEGYPDTYQDAMGIIGNKIKSRGGKLLGFTPTTGHHYEASLGVENGQFMGLALDEDSQADKSLTRIKNWTKQLIRELKIDQ